MVLEVSARISTGAAAGLNLRNDGIDGRSLGKSVSEALIAACTSRAAPSMLRARSNCTMIEVCPSDETEVISVTPAMVARWRSSGAATVAAMIAGSAPGRLAETRIVGSSTLGMLETGRNRQATIPTSSNPTASSVVPIGRMMNGYEKFICLLRGLRRGAWRRTACHADAQALHREIDHRRGVERQQLAEQQAADDRDAEREAQLRARAALEGERHRAEQRGERGHHDRPEAEQRGLRDRFARRHAVTPLGLEREVDHHDGILLHDAHQQHDADQRDDRKILPD